MSRLVRPLLAVLAALLCLGATNGGPLPGKPGSGVSVAVTMCVETMPRSCGPNKAKLAAALRTGSRSKWPENVRAAGVVRGPDIACPPDCSTVLDANQTVTLSATGKNDRTYGRYRFVRWEGQVECATVGASSCRFAANAKQESVIAVFESTYR